MNVFSQRLKWLREKRGRTQKDIAEMLGISQQYYGRFEKGTGQPNLEVLAKMPKLLGESTDFLLGVTDIDSETDELMAHYLNHKYQLERYKEKYNNALEVLEDAFHNNEEIKIDMLTRLKGSINFTEKMLADSEKSLFQYVSQIPCIKKSTIKELKSKALPY